VSVFPDEDSVVRLAGAVLADIHAESETAEGRYFFESSLAKLTAEPDNGAGSPATLEVVG
jgi:hypothetical protein